jgi:hypothetical protein
MEQHEEWDEDQEDAAAERVYVAWCKRDGRKLGHMRHEVFWGGAPSLDLEKWFHKKERQRRLWRKLGRISAHDGAKRREYFIREQHPEMHDRFGHVCDPDEDIRDMPIEKLW